MAEDLQVYNLPPSDPGFTTVDQVKTLITAQLSSLQSNIRIGGGNEVFRASSEGIQLGNGTFSLAPFSVDMQGNLVATSATINGSPLDNSHVFGSGVDGIATISTDTSLSADAYYDTLTVTSSSRLNTNGWRLFVKNTLTIDVGSKISFNGNAGTNASGATKGTGGTALTGHSLHGSLAGLDGTDGGARPGGSSGLPTNGTTVTNSYCSSFSDTGGTGGGSNAGGTALPAGAAGSITASVTRPYSAASAILYLDFADSTAVKYLRYNGHAGSSRGGRAGSDGGGSGGDGGGSGGNGSNGGNVMVAARKIVNNGSIEALGGAGGNGATGGTGTGGGGGGGGGGAGVGGAGGEVVVVYSTLSGTGTISAAAGANGVAGSGGAGSPAGNAGGSATGPSAGVVIQLVV